MHVIFGTGSLGQAVASVLLARDRDVRLANRSGQPPAGFEEVETVAGDLAKPTAARDAAQGADVVYHCAVTPYAEWPHTLPALMEGAIDAAASVGARLVYGDNLYAYGPSDEPLTETTPEQPTTRKGRVRKEVADMLRRAHEEGRVQATIGRASDFYGPGIMNSAVGHEVFGRLAAGQAPRLLGDPDQPHSFTYIEDFGRALVVLAEHEKAFGETWHVPNAPPVSTRSFVLKAAKAMGREAPQVSAAPSWLIKVVGWFRPMIGELAEMLYLWEKPFVVDHSKFERAFGDEFGEVTPLNEGISQTAAALQAEEAPAA